MAGAAVSFSFWSAATGGVLPTFGSQSQIQNAYGASLNGSGAIGGCGMSFLMPNSPSINLVAPSFQFGFDTSDALWNMLIVDEPDGSLICAPGSILFLSADQVPPSMLFDVTALWAELPI